jgi:hypothetical protein
MHWLFAMVNAIDNLKIQTNLTYLLVMVISSEPDVMIRLPSLGHQNGCIVWNRGIKLGKARMYSVPYAT